MKLIDEFRDPDKAKGLALAIRDEAGKLTGELRFMEVCGTHTMAIFRFGIRDMLPKSIGLVSGPGCPVCVTATPEVDRAIELCLRPGVILATFGDMIKVPGARMSLGAAKAEGGKVAVVYSTFEALELARKNPDNEVVFLGIGFETTAPTVAAAVHQAHKQGLANFSVLSSHKTLPPALDALLSGGKTRVSGFIMPGHVTTIIGAKAYEPVTQAHNLPCVVTGFEPLDILSAILMLTRQAVRGESRVEIQYQRGASWDGNLAAQGMLAKVFEPTDSLWRGLGMIPGSGLGLRDEYTKFDAARRFGLPASSELTAEDPPGCRCGEVLQGLVIPPECPLFKKTCGPDTPVGPCMVSSEGTCAAYYKYH